MNTNNYYLIAYWIYLVVTVSITILVAKTLFTNGKIFLVDIFHGNVPLATSVNNLLLTGFYLVNIGYALYMLRTTADLHSFRDIIELLSVKIGLIVLVLGGMHFGNLAIFFKLRKRALENTPAL